MATTEISLKQGKYLCLEPVNHLILLCYYFDIYSIWVFTLNFWRFRVKGNFSSHFQIRNIKIKLVYNKMIIVIIAFNKSKSFFNVYIRYLAEESFCFYILNRNVCGLIRLPNTFQLV